MTKHTLLLASLLAFGCSSGNGTTDGPAVVHDMAMMGSMLDMTMMGAMGDMTMPGNGDLAASGFTLTITNYLNWCSIQENGAAFAPTMNFPANTKVDLSAMPLQGFIWAYWTGTDGDKTMAHDTMMMTTVTMTADKTVLACCPFANAPTCP